VVTIISKIVESEGHALGSPSHALQAEKRRKAAVKRVEPSVKYFHEKFFNVDALLRPQLDTYRACRLLDPHQIVGLQAHVTAAGGHLADVPFIAKDPQRQARLFLELELYVKLAAQAPPGMVPLPFFHLHRDKLPEFRWFAHEAVHLKANSASAERVYGLTANLFSELQHNQLNDAACASVMLRFNNRNHARKKTLDDDLVRGNLHTAAILFPLHGPVPPAPLPPPAAPPGAPPVVAVVPVVVVAAVIAAVAAVVAIANVPALPHPGPAPNPVPAALDPVPVPGLLAQAVPVAAPPAPAQAVPVAAPPAPAQAVPVAAPGPAPPVPAPAPPVRASAPDNQEEAFVAAAGQLVGRRNRQPSAARLLAIVSRAEGKNKGKRKQGKGGKQGKNKKRKVGGKASAEDDSDSGDDSDVASASEST
jgi:hypothetical protein